MTEVLLVASGAIFALCAVLTGAAYHFASKAQATLELTRSDAQASLIALRIAASDIADAHNSLALTQVEQGQTLERLMTEVAGRQIARR